MITYTKADVIARAAKLEKYGHKQAAKMLRDFAPMIEQSTATGEFDRFPETSRRESAVRLVLADGWNWNGEAWIRPPAQAAQVDVIGHPRAPDEQRDEIELYLRDAYAAGCHAAQSLSMVTALEYAHREAPKLRAIVKPTAAPQHGESA